jgi:serine/threonine protein kinase
MICICPSMISLGNDEKAFEFLDLMAARLVLGENEFHLLDEIGSGTYAKVYKAIDYHHQREVAIKCMLLDSERYGLLCVVVREINLLLDLKHPNIVHLYDIIRRDNEIYLILEYMNTDLYQYLLRHPRPLADIQVKVYFYQLLNGLDFCHRNQSLSRRHASDCSFFFSLLVFHRDLKYVHTHTHLSVARLIRENVCVDLADFPREIELG